MTTAINKDNAGALIDKTIALFEAGSSEAADEAFELSHRLVMELEPASVAAINAFLNIALHIAKMLYQGRSPSDKVRAYFVAGYDRHCIDYVFIDPALGISVLDGECA